MGVDRSTGLDAPTRLRRARSFGSVADSYASARPSYPAPAVRWLAGTAPRDVVDVAAGTGKLTESLRAAGHRVVAVDPSATMLKALRRNVPDVPVVSGIAEALPLAAGAGEVVTVAQGWHWFRADRAADEMARVLRRGGRLALVWNERVAVPWVQAVWSRLSPAGMSLLAPDWRELLDRHPAFGRGELAEFDHVQLIAPDQVIALAASRSGVAILADDERARLLAEVRAVLDDHPDTRGRDRLELPYRAVCFRWSRR